ncbi:MAG: hypothetical protein MJZ57_01155 [Bacteroidales bacterium]|nr:hypothetical protein [Bacteroidales bacterium]
MENNQVFIELDEMRAQISLLNKKLEKESIINERLLRDAMKSKARTINANAWVSVGASAFVIIWALFFFPAEGFSWCFTAATILMMLVCDFFTWKHHKNVNSKTMNGDLVTVAKVMKKLKDDYVNSLKYGIIMVIFWFVWLATEYCIILKDWKLSILIIVSLLLSLAIGGYIGIRMHKSVIHNAEDIIKQIEEE